MTTTGRHRSLTRALRLWRQLDGLHRRPPLADLAAQHGVTTRTIRRDLDTLAECGCRLPKAFNPELLSS